MTTITNDEYQIWRENPVTMRLMEEIKERLDGERDGRIMGSTMEELAIGAAERNVAMNMAEMVLEWKPEELEENDD